MTRWYVAQVHTTDARRVRERLAEQGYEPETVNGFGYILFRPSGPPGAALGVDGIIRLLPSNLNPQPLREDAAEAFLATVRAYRQVTAAADPEAEPVIATYARSALARLLRDKFDSVTVDGARVEPATALPEPGRSNHGHDQRRAARAGA